MKDIRGSTALVTGASGGIGAEISRALAREGVNLVLSGRREDALSALAGEVGALGVGAHTLTAELQDLSQASALVDRAEQAAGAIDILVNNAGIELVSAFARYTEDELRSVIDINLTAPLLITHAAVPRMLERGRGHVVFIASVAGKIGPAYEEPYAASKAGLIGLTQALRAEYRDAPIGFSVISPGFTGGEGMYQRMADDGIRSNRLLGTTSTTRVAARVIEAIRRDRPDVVESGSPVRPLLAISQLAPRLGEAVMARSGATEMFRRAAAQRGRE